MTSKKKWAATSRRWEAECGRLMAENERIKADLAMRVDRQVYGPYWSVLPQWHHPDCGCPACEAERLRTVQATGTS